MASTEESVQFEALLGRLKRDRGFDFTGYKRTTLQRRVQKRLEAVGLRDYDDYLELLDRDADEFTQLFNTLLINVTRFFRDDSPWVFLAQDVIPALLARHGDTAPIRVWSAGCASGEEAYSLAMLFAEALGPQRFGKRVKIYATDVEEDALGSARSATYSEKQVRDVPPALRVKYFEPLDGRFMFAKDLRRSVIFGRNDLVQDAPISQVDLLVCRNTLMYFDSATQGGILARFHFALTDHGVLFLGRAETLLAQSSAFVPIDRKRRIFRKVSRLSFRERLLVGPTGARRDGSDAPNHRLRDAAFQTGGEAQIVVDCLGRPMLANAGARRVFALTETDLAQPLEDLEVSDRPVELRSLIEQSHTDRRSVLLREVMWRPRSGATDRWMDVEITPLIDGDGTALGASIVFTDVTTTKRLKQELEDSRQSVQTAYEELHSTNEELETTNDQLQSTVEELETTNVELQSTNEELATMNEELQSANEALETRNDEFRRRGEELDELNAFLESLFAGLRNGVIVLDLEYRVRVWSAESEALWGIRRREAIGSNVMTLNIGLPMEQLDGPMRSVLSGQMESATVTITAVDCRGRTLQCDVSCAALVVLDGSVRGVIITVNEAD